MTVGCSSVYHQVARSSPGGASAWLDVRTGQAVDAHRRALVTVEAINADLKADRAVRFRGARLERMRDERIDAEGLAWRARKSIASIDDVLGLDTEAGINDARRVRAGEIRDLLGRASDELDAASVRVGGAVERFADGADATDGETDAISAHTDRARALIDQAKNAGGG